jgi:multiple sugar transport system substrate-binding protein
MSWLSGSSHPSRRAFLRGTILSAGALTAGQLLAACSAPAAPTAAPASGAAPAKSAEPTKPAEAAKPAEATKPAAAAAAATSAPAGGAAQSTPAAKPATGAQQVTLNFQHFFTGVLWTGGFQQLTEMFEKQNPNIKFGGAAVPYAEMMPKLITLAAGGQPPDGTSLDNERIQSVILRGLLKELDPYMQADRSLNIEDFYKARLESQQSKGKTYGIPIDMGSGAIYYNKDMFDKAGLKYPDPKWTWNDVRDLALKLTLDNNGKRPGEAGFDKGNVKQWGFQYRPQPYRFYNVMRGYNGAEYFDKDVTKTRIAEPEGISAMQWFADLRNKDFVAPSPAADQAMRAGGIQPFTSGGWAMEHTWIGLIANLHEAGAKVTNYDVVNLPDNPNSAQEVGGQGFVVINGAKNADAAWAWTRFMAGDDAQKFMGTNGVWFPSRKSMAKSGIPKDGKPENFMSAFYDQVDKHGVACWWFVPGWEQWATILQNEFDQMWLGARDAKATATAIKDKLDPLVANWRKSIGQ